MFLTVASEPKGISSFFVRKISKGAAPMLLERVVKLGTPKMQVNNGTRSVLASGANR